MIPLPQRVFRSAWIVASQGWLRGWFGRRRFFCVWLGARWVNSTGSVESVRGALPTNPQIRQAAGHRLYRVLFPTAAVPGYCFTRTRLRAKLRHGVTSLVKG
jgi:hypothetical protein